MFGHTPKKKETSSDGREYGHSHSEGAFDAEEMARAHAIVEAIGTQKEQGFVILVKRKTVEKDAEHESVEVDGIVKVSKTNKKFMLDTVFHALGMDTKEIIQYATLRAVQGSDYKDDDSDE